MSNNPIAVMNPSGGVAPVHLYKCELSGAAVGAYPCPGDPAATRSQGLWWHSRRRDEHHELFSVGRVRHWAVPVPLCSTVPPESSIKGRGFRLQNPTFNMPLFRKSHVGLPLSSIPLTDVGHRCRTRTTKSSTILLPVAMTQGFPVLVPILTQGDTANL